MRLFRPVGVRELALIAAAGWRGFPPRLPEQPIFYPVLNRDYARQIARDWNPTDEASGFAGFVTAFEIDDDYGSRFERQVVGSSEHEELWVPAEELERFNNHIAEPIRVVDSFYGEQFVGDVDPANGLPLSVIQSIDQGDWVLVVDARTQPAQDAWAAWVRTHDATGLAPDDVRIDHVRTDDAQGWRRYWVKRTALDALADE